MNRIESRIQNPESSSQNPESRIQKNRVSYLFCILTSVFWILFPACSGKKSHPPWEYMPNMVSTPAVKAQAAPMRVPPEGTLALGFEPYPYTKDQGDLAGAQLLNPLARTKESFLQGQKAYNTYCIVCHGERGKGDGPIIPKFPRPPSLSSEKLRNWSDGRIYHVIMAGQNLMPSYASQIRPEDRWAIVLYIRALQRAAEPKPEDVETILRVLKEGKIL